MTDPIDTSAQTAADKLGKIVNHKYSGGDVLMYDCQLAKVTFNDIRTLLSERDALAAQLAEARNAALDEAAKVAFDGDEVPELPYDEWGDTKADTSERHANNVTNHALWNVSCEIRALKEKTDD